MPERHVGDAAGAAALQPSLALAAEGVQRWVWQGRYGPMLIEVVGQQVLVNGQPVQPHQP